MAARRKKPGPKPGTGGRPTKYRPAMCKRVVELMRKGRSRAQVCADLGIHTDTLAEWIKRYPDFSAALKEGTTFSEAAWTRLGDEIASGERQGNATVWIFNMKNRFGWRDQKQHEHTGKDGGSITLDFKSLIGEGTEDDDE